MASTQESSSFQNNSSDLDELVLGRRKYEIDQIESVVIENFTELADFLKYI